MLKINQKSKGIIFIIIAAFGFSGMSLFVKLSGDLPAFQKAFFRNFVALIFIFFVILKNKEGFIPDKKSIRIRMHQKLASERNGREGCGSKVPQLLRLRPICLRKIRREGDYGFHEKASHRDREGHRNALEKEKSRIRKAL